MADVDPELEIAAVLQALGPGWRARIDESYRVGISLDGLEALDEVQPDQPAWMAIARLARRAAGLERRVRAMIAVGEGAEVG